MANKLPKRNWHFHVKSFYVMRGEVSFNTERIVNEPDMMELVHRHATGWNNNVAVYPCYKPECKVGDIGG